MHVICGDVFVFVNNRISWKNMRFVRFLFCVRFWRKLVKNEVKGTSWAVVDEWNYDKWMKRKGESNDHCASVMIITCRLWYGLHFFLCLFRIAIVQAAIGDFDIKWLLKWKMEYFFFIFMKWNCPSPEIDK